MSTKLRAAKLDQDLVFRFTDHWIHLRRLWRWWIEECHLKERSPQKMDESTTNDTELVEEPNRKVTLVLSAALLGANVLLVLVLALDRTIPGFHQALMNIIGKQWSSESWKRFLLSERQRLLVDQRLLANQRLLVIKGCWLISCFCLISKASY